MKGIFKSSPLLLLNDLDTLILFVNSLVVLYVKIIIANNFDILLT